MHLRHRNHPVYLSREPEDMSALGGDSSMIDERERERDESPRNVDIPKPWTIVHVCRSRVTSFVVARAYID